MLRIEVIRTTGDRVQDRTLAEIGGKGLFTKEIEEALLAGTIDLAVHSMKDVATILPERLVMAALLPRADPRDVLIAGPVTSIGALPEGAVVGTASLRRGAQMLAHRPDLRVVPLRGNVQTRLAKVERGEVAATLLAAAGLARLGLGLAGGVPLSAQEMVPAVAQGAIGLQCRAGDGRMRDLLHALDDGPTSTVRRGRALAPGDAGRLVPDTDRGPRPPRRGRDRACCAAGLAGRSTARAHDATRAGRRGRGDRRRCRSGASRPGGRLAPSATMTDEAEATPQRLCVLVTRPRQQSLVTARRLHAMGHRAIIDPLLVIRTIDAGPLDVGSAAAVVLTSSNGLRGMDVRLMQLPVFAVGQATAAAAQRAGCTDVRSADGDGVDLAKLVARWLQPEAGEILHLAGDEVRPGLAEALAAAGYAYRQRTVYAAAPATGLSGANAAGADGRPDRCRPLLLAAHGPRPSHPSSRRRVSCSPWAPSRRSV